MFNLQFNLQSWNGAWHLTHSLSLEGMSIWFRWIHGGDIRFEKLGEDFLVLSAQKCPVVYFHFQQLLEAGAKSDFTKDQVQFSNRVENKKQQYFTITLFFLTQCLGVGSALLPFFPLGRG